MGAFPFCPNAHMGVFPWRRAFLSCPFFGLLLLLAERLLWLTLHLCLLFDSFSFFSVYMHMPM